LLAFFSSKNATFSWIATPLFVKKTAHKGKLKNEFRVFVLCGDDLTKNLYPKSALFKAISSKKTFEIISKSLFKPYRK